MENKQVSRFIVIDDDPINNHICTKYIQLVFPGANVLTYTNPKVALNEIESAYAATTGNDTILLLDINMPILNGWEVLDRLGDFSEGILQQLKIYILSSSIAIDDQRRADEHRLVSGFIAKPLSVEQLENLFSGS